MMMEPRINFKERINEWAANGTPFVFITDFEMEQPIVLKESDLESAGIFFSINPKAQNPDSTSRKLNNLQASYILQSHYNDMFSKVKNHLNYGDTFLVNLTIKTRIRIPSTLEQLYHDSKAKYKLWFRDKFLVFSPETFVKIIDRKIYSFPMKGTIDASLPNAREKLLNDEKEKAEHNTIVDLIRNDLSAVASNVKVTRFRYIEELTTNRKSLLQTSSEIVGELPHDYKSRLGDILSSLLPAGSVSGAPKPKTCEIIAEVEGEKRGYYTGVFGYFDGKNLDSAVMIRFIEQNGTDYYYRSGGGITSQSDPEVEYNEAIDKVYVPIG